MEASEEVWLMMRLRQMWHAYIGRGTFEALIGFCGGLTSLAR